MQVGRAAADGFEVAAGDDAKAFACFAPQTNAHAVADVKNHHLAAIIEQANPAVGHHAVDVAENQFDLGTGSGEGHGAKSRVHRSETASSLQRAGAWSSRAFRRENSHGRFGGFRSGGFLLRFGFQANHVRHVDQSDGSPIGRHYGQFAEFSLRQERNGVADARAAQRPSWDWRPSHRESVGRGPLRRGARTAVRDRYR